MSDIITLYNDHINPEEETLESILENTILELLGNMDDNVIYDLTEFCGIMSVDAVSYDPDLETELPYHFYNNGQEVNIDVKELLCELWDI